MKRLALLLALTACDLPEGECTEVDGQPVLLSTCYEFNLPATQFDFDGTCDDWCEQKGEGAALYTAVPVGGVCSDDPDDYVLEAPDAKVEGVARCVCECGGVE